MYMYMDNLQELVMLQHSIKFNVDVVYIGSLCVVVEDDVIRWQRVKERTFVCVYVYVCVCVYRYHSRSLVTTNIISVGFGWCTKSAEVGHIRDIT